MQSQFETDFKKEWAEEHPSQSALEGKLSEEHQAIVDERVKKQARADMTKLIEEGFKKCEFLLKFETKESVISVDSVGIIPQKINTWTNWDVQFA